MIEPRKRDKAVESTCANLIMAGGILMPAEVAGLMRELAGYSDKRLALALISSVELLNAHLTNKWSRN